MFQTADDFVIFLGWAFHNIILLLKQFFLPVRYVFAFLKTSIAHAFASPILPDNIWSFDTDTLTLIHTFPYFDVLVAGVMVGFGIIFLVAFFKMFQRI